jgi:hypothetical protein
VPPGTVALDYSIVVVVILLLVVAVVAGSLPYNQSEPFCLLSKPAANSLPKGSDIMLYVTLYELSKYSYHLPSVGKS